MHKKLLSSISIVLFIVSFVAPVFAQSMAPRSETLVAQADTKKSSSKTGKKKRKKKKSQWGYIKKGSAAVYQYANFDAQIIQSYEYNTKIRISKKLYKGIGGLGLFYKVRVQKGVFGYIADVDVSLVSPEAAKDVEQEEEKSSWGASFYDEPQDPNAESFFLSSYWGMAFYNTKYSEVINKSTEVGSISLFGLNYSGPTGLFGGFPVDVDILISTSAPSFYSSYFTSASGFMLHTSGSIMVPALETKDAMLYYLGGVTAIYTKYDLVPTTTPENSPVDSQELKVGPLLGLGGAYRFGKIALRGSFKYYYETKGYLGLGFSGQYQF